MYLKVCIGVPLLIDAGMSFTEPLNLMLSLRGASERTDATLQVLCRRVLGYGLGFRVLSYFA